MYLKFVLAASIYSAVLGCSKSNDLESAYTPAMRMEDEIAAREHTRICANPEERKAHPEEQCQDNR
jgi:hypothetical protein